MSQWVGEGGGTWINLYTKHLSKSWPSHCYYAQNSGATTDCTLSPELGIWSFALTQCSSKGVTFTPNLAIKICHFWAKLIKITCPQSNDLDRNAKNFIFHHVKTASAQLWLSRTKCQKRALRLEAASIQKKNLARLSWADRKLWGLSLSLKPGPFCFRVHRDHFRAWKQFCAYSETFDIASLILE